MFDKLDFGILIRPISGIAFLHNKLIPCGVKCPEGACRLKRSSCMQFSSSGEFVAYTHKETP